jgi:predicted transcriptional regulator
MRIQEDRMSRHPKRLLATGSALVVLAAGTLVAGGAALAQSSGPTAKSTVAAKAKLGKRHGHGLRAAAAYLGQTPQQLRQQLRQGRSLAQIANATPGKTVEGLKAAIAGPKKARVDQVVANGRLTAAQGQRLKTRIDTMVDRLVNRTWTASASKPRPTRAARPFSTAAQYLGLTPQQLRQQLRGRSLAQVAGSTQGKTVAGLKAAIASPKKARVDRAVANGRLTAAQAERLKARIDARVDRLVNRVWR